MDDGKWDPDKLADGRRDFREEIEERDLFGEVVRRIDNSADALRRAKSVLRLSSAMRFYLIGELLNTDKSVAAIAAKFGVTPQAVRKHRKKLIASIRAGEKIRYGRDGRLVYGDLSKESIMPGPNVECGAHCRAFLSEAKKTPGGTRGDGEWKSRW